MKKDCSEKSMSEAMIIGKNLRSVREHHGYSQQKIAEVLGVSFQQVQKYEKGHNRLSAEKLHYLKKLYGVSYSRFFEGVKGEGPSTQLAVKTICNYEDIYSQIRVLKDPDLKEKIHKIIEIQKMNINYF